MWHWSGRFPPARSPQYLLVSTRPSVSEVAALKIDRLVIDAVNMNHLAMVQLIERYNALAPDRRENGLVRLNWPKVLDEFIGTLQEYLPRRGRQRRPRRNVRIE